MTKKHHPSSREERLKIKYEKQEPKGVKKPTHTKQRIKEFIKDQETLHDLRQVNSRLYQDARTSKLNLLEPD